MSTDRLKSDYMMVQQLLVDCPTSSTEADITPDRPEPDFIPDRLVGSVLEARKLA